MADLNKAIELQPGEAEFYNIRGLENNSAGSVDAALADLSKAIELNNSSFITRTDSFPNCTTFAEMAKKYNALVAINSDAHICYNVGENEKASALAAKVGIRPSQIINSSARQVYDFLNQHKNEAARKKA